jgi:predicted RNA-binding Zn-ribbon protein involved in translation (DUF1610 family)
VEGEAEVADMTRFKTSGKPPSRRRYEEQNPTVSFRLKRELKEDLKEHLKGTGCSYADFVKDALGREKAMIDERVEILASKRLDAQLEDGVRCLENLVHEVFSLTVDNKRYPPLCPRCDNQELFRCEGREAESKLAHPWVLTWKCPACGFFVNTYKRIDPASTKWIDPDSGSYVDKPKPSARHWLRK